MKKIENSNGVTFYVGQNSKENDELYNALKNKKCYWFHLDQGPSAHVYAKSQSILTKHDIKEAAILVRQHSKGQGKVIYLPCSKIRLIGGGTIEMLDEPKKA